MFGRPVDENVHRDFVGGDARHDALTILAGIETWSPTLSKWPVGCFDMMVTF